MPDQAFDGVRVVEVAQWVFVPVAGALLADWGADVVHIEPIEGDPYRGLATQGIGAESSGVNLSLALANRGKRSLALDIQARARTRRLAPAPRVGRCLPHQHATRGAAARSGSTPTSSRSVTRAWSTPEVMAMEPAGPMPIRRVMTPPRSGLGRYGPYSDAARPRLSHRPTWAMGDRNGAMALAFGVSAALLKRTRTGAGSVVDVSLLATAMWTLSSDLLAALGGDEPKASSGRGPLVNPLVGVYRTKDDRHIQLVFLQPDRYWADFCRVIDRPDLAEDARFADIVVRRENGEACVAELDRSSPSGPSTSGKRSWLASTRRGRPCSRFRSCSTTRRWRRTDTSATW